MLLTVYTFTNTLYYQFLVSTVAFDASPIQNDSPGAFMMHMHARKPLDNILIKDVPVLSFTIVTAYVAPHLGMVLDSELTPAAYNAAKCKVGYYQL